MDAKVQIERERIARLTEKDKITTEEDVKQKVIVPLLELLGHKREDLEFEHRTRGRGRMDIFVKNVPPDCKAIIDTKNYHENLNDHVEQIKEYTFNENALLAVIANGTEIRIYSPLRGVAFERSLLYSIKRQELASESLWTILSGLLHHESLRSKSVLLRIEEREREIKDAMTKEERLTEEYKSRIEGIESDIEAKEDEIEQLRQEGNALAKKLESEVANIWRELDLPSDLFAVPPPPIDGSVWPEGRDPQRKARRVSLQELVDAGLLKDGQVLHFHHTRPFPEDQAQVVASANKLKYRLDGRTYSISDLALKLLKKHGFKRDNHGVQGAKYWCTEDEKLIHDLNEQLRARRGDR